MANLRLIARLDVKAPYLIKGTHLEGLRKVGDPRSFAERYYREGIDEIIYIDSVASLYERNTIVDLVSRTAEKVFVPITVGGGIRSVDDARILLRAGADKIAINTAAIKNPDLIRDMSRQLGSQCVVLSIQAKSTAGGWKAYGDNGREPSEWDAIEWAREAENLGAGEILVTSIDREGTLKGFDIALVRAIASVVDVPVIASGGLGSVDHVHDVVVTGCADAVAIANVLHYNKLSLHDIRSTAASCGRFVRQDFQCILP